MAFVDVLMAGPFNMIKSDAELSARLWKAHLNGLDDTRVANLCTLLARGELTPDSGWFLGWDGRFTQWQRSGIGGVAIETLFGTLHATLYDGATIRRLFDRVAEPNGSVLPSEIVFRWCEHLIATRTGAQISTLFDRLLTDMALSKAQCRTFMQALVGRNPAPSGTQIETVSAAIHTAKNAIPGMTAAGCAELAESIGRSHQSNLAITNFFTAPTAPLLLNPCIRLALELGFDYGHELVTTGALQVSQATTACNNNPGNLLHVLTTAQSLGVTAADLLRFLPFLTGMAAVSAHTRMGTFFTQASAARNTNRADGRSWAQIAALVQRFIVAGRRALVPLAGVSASLHLAVGADTVRVTHERILYFIRAHTFSHCDFTITDRTHDVISFWDTMNVMQMRTEVSDVKDELGDLVAQARDQPKMQVQLVGAYDVGILHEGGTNFAMLHFHPLPTHMGMAAVHSQLVAAISHLF